MAASKVSGFKGIKKRKNFLNFSKRKGITYESFVLFEVINSSIHYRWMGGKKESNLKNKRESIINGKSRNPHGNDMCYVIYYETSSKMLKSLLKFQRNVFYVYVQIVWAGRERARQKRGAHKQSLI